MPAKRPELALVTMCLGAFISILDASIVNLGLHSIQEGLGSSVAGLQWVVNVYNVTYAALILTGGTLADLYGRRRIFIIGLAIFGAGSLVCALAPSAAVLIAGRAVAGAGAALELPASLAILSIGFSDDRARTRAIAIWAASYGLGMAVGPSVGGFLVERLGWRSLFYVIIPIVGATLLLAATAVEESSDPKGRRLDVPGQLLAAAALVALCLGLIEGPSWGWASGATLGAFATMLASVSGFLWVEGHRPGPMIDLGIFRRRAFSAAIVDAGLMTFGNYAFLFIFPLFLQSVRHDSAEIAGLMLLPMSLSYFLVSSLLAGRLANRFGPRAVVAGGMIANGAGIAGLGFVGPESPFLVLALGLFAVGVGLGIITGPINNAATANAPRTRSGMSSGLVNVGRMVGATLGVALLGTVLGSRAGQGAADAPRFLAGMRLAFIIAGAAEVAGALVAVAGLRRDSLRATG
jgi:DHA2 family methylenomycin A resistance protein-like MFS transporter